MTNRTQQHLNESARALAIEEARAELAEAEEQLRTARALVAQAEQLVERRRERLTRLTAPPKMSERYGKSRMWK